MDKEMFVKINVLRRTPGFGNVKTIQALSKGSLLPQMRGDAKQFEEIYDYCKANGIGMLSYFDAAYPEKLKSIKNPPVLLYYKGDVDLLNRPSVAIVGSRESSKEALVWAAETAKSLAGNDVVLVSGGATGVDATAHKAVIEEGGLTIGVLGCGFDSPYPSENAALYEKIAEDGLLVSELPPNEKGDRFSLLGRNRITSGIADAVLVVASKMDGGAQAQAKVAMEQHKKILVPSAKFYPREGIERLLKQDYAVVVEDDEDILQQLVLLTHHEE